MERSYESMIVIVPTISEEDAKKENEKVLSVIQKAKGEIVNTDEWGKKKLAYEIQKHKEGFYFVNYFKMDADLITELDRTYRLNENIIRFNILIKD